MNSQVERWERRILIHAYEMRSERNVERMRDTVSFGGILEILAYISWVEEKGIEGKTGFRRIGWLEKSSSLHL